MLSTAPKAPKGVQQTVGKVLCGNADFDELHLENVTIASESYPKHLCQPDSTLPSLGLSEEEPSHELFGGDQGLTFLPPGPPRIRTHTHSGSDADSDTDEDYAALLDDTTEHLSHAMRHLNTAVSMCRSHTSLSRTGSNRSITSISSPSEVEPPFIQTATRSDSSPNSGSDSGGARGVKSHPAKQASRLLLVSHASPVTGGDMSRGNAQDDSARKVSK